MWYLYFAPLVSSIGKALLARTDEALTSCPGYDFMLRDPAEPLMASHRCLLSVNIIPVFIFIVPC